MYLRWLLVKTSAVRNVDNQNVDKSKRQQTKTSTNQHVDVSVCRRFGLSTFWLSTFRFVDVLISYLLNDNRQNVCVGQMEGMWPYEYLNRHEFYMSHLIDSVNKHHTQLLSWTAALIPVNLRCFKRARRSITQHCTHSVYIPNKLFIWVTTMWPLGGFCWHQKMT